MTWTLAEILSCFVIKKKNVELIIVKQSLATFCFGVEYWSLFGVELLEFYLGLSFEV